MDSLVCEFCGGPTTHLSLKQVARLLGKSKPTIARYIREGRFPGTVKIPGRTAPWIYKIPVSAVFPLVEQ